MAGASTPRWRRRQPPNDGLLKRSRRKVKLEETISGAQRTSEQLTLRNGSIFNFSGRAYEGPSPNAPDTLSQLGEVSEGLLSGTFDRDSPELSISDDIDSAELDLRDPSEFFPPELNFEDDWRYDDGLFLNEESENLLCADKSTSKDTRATMDKPLYVSAKISVAETLLIIMAYINCHRITDKALADMLKLITLLCPDNLNTNCLSSVQNFKAFFRHDESSPVVMHKYCNNCLVALQDDLSQCQSCEMSESQEGLTSTFIEVPIDAQIKALFLKPGFREKLDFRFTRQKNDFHNIEEIYDADIYKQHTVGGGPLSDPRNISLTWNTDGVPIFKSSKFSVWPFYCIINELRFIERTKRENMIFAGLWYGNTKPDMLTFLKPLSDTLIKLEEHGIYVRHSEESEPLLCKVLTIAGTCDLPAKALVFNSVQFNGRFGCLKCEQPGVTVKTGARGHVHVFPFNKSDPKGPPRTREKFIDDAKMAHMTQTTVAGVKGPCWLSRLKSYDLIRSTGVDYMHAVLLGVMRTLLFLWFSSEFSRQPFSMSKDLKEIDKRLKAVNPPSSIRNPRSIASHKMYFKASEYRALLLFFGPVVFRGILGVVYYNHFLLLSEAVFILLMESISMEQIAHAEKLLWNFSSQMGHLYGARYLTANVHLLVHLADSVRALGPLWTHSCFHFEDKNGYLLRLIHGTQNIAMQMVNAVKLVQSLPTIAQAVKPDSIMAEFYARLTNDFSFCQEYSCLSKSHLIGSSSDQQLEPKHRSALEEYFGHQIQYYAVRAFNRAQIGRTRLTSRKYGRGNRKNNFTVAYSDGTQVKYGQIEFFFSHQERGAISELALISGFPSAGFSLLQDNLTHCSCSHIVSLLKTPVSTAVVPLADILGKVVFLDLPSMPGIAFAAHFPNTLERD